MTHFSGVKVLIKSRQGEVALAKFKVSCPYKHLRDLPQLVRLSKVSSNDFD